MNVIARPPAAPAASPAATPVATSPTTLPAPSTLAPANFTELVEFAEIAARSQFVPKDYRNHPEDILLAVQLGSEVGLRPMQALQNIAVINGRPAVWGDALPGLCKASHVYEDLIETFEREDDPGLSGRGLYRETSRLHACDCTLLRHGRQARWFVDQGRTLATYPRRMLQMRARSFALRDAFPDVLKGLISVEEALDLPAPNDRLPSVRTTIDATPEPPPPTPTLSPPERTPTKTPVTAPAAENAPRSGQGSRFIAFRPTRA